MIGYVMVIYDYDVPEYDIWHMMIDESIQGNGFGKAALDQVIRYIQTKPFGTSSRVALTCNKNNPIARKLYESRGFLATGVEDEDEIEMAFCWISKRLIHPIVSPMVTLFSVVEFVNAKMPISHLK